MKLTLFLRIGAVITGLLLYSDAYSKSMSCPEGYRWAEPHKLCQSDDVAEVLAFNSTTTLPCALGFERVPGVDACIAKKSTLEKKDGVFLVKPYYGHRCPEHFARFPQRRVCVHTNLVLRSEGSKVTLDALSAQHKSLNQAYAPCPAGLMRPPGMAFCADRDIIYGAELPLGLSAPDIGCENTRNWVRAETRHFCIPKHQVVDITRSGLDLTSVRKPLCGKVDDDGLHAYGACCSFQVESWMSLPHYSANGQFQGEYIVTQSCTDFDLTGTVD